MSSPSNEYYRHFFCGGTFYVDLLAKVYAVAPALYVYVCDRCGKRKTMPCEAEVKELSK